MKHAYRLWTAMILLFVAGGMISCSDDPSSSDTGNPPSVPKIKNHQPKTAYFDDNYPAGSNKAIAAEYTHFNTAALVVISSASSLTFTQELANGFLAIAENNQANQDDGQWNWEYSYSYMGESMSIELIAAEQDNGDMKWEMYLSSSSSDGPDFEDYKYMEGTVAADGNSGSWSIFDFDPEQDSNPALTFQWEAVSDTEKTMKFTAYDDDAWSMVVNYEENGDDFKMSIEDDSDQSVTEVVWNTNTGVGYMVEGDVQTCWNADFENVACSN